MDAVLLGHDGDIATLTRNNPERRAQQGDMGVPRRLRSPWASGELQSLPALAGCAATLELLLEGRVFDVHEVL